MKHYLSHNAKCEIPSNLLFVAVATRRHKSGKHTIYLDLKGWVARHVRLEGQASRSEVKYQGNDAESFWALVPTLQQARKPLWIVSYNAIHTLTLLKLWEELDRERLAIMVGGKYRVPDWFKLDTAYRGIMAVDGLPFIVKCLSPKGAIWMIDLLNYWTASMAELATMVNYTHSDANHFHESLDNEEPFVSERVLITQKVFLRLIISWRTLELGNWKPTAAGLSLTSFRHLVCDTRRERIKGFERFNILIDKNHPAIPLEREAYRGGRVEAFYIGNVIEDEYPAYGFPNHLLPYVVGPVYLLDIRSMYPRIMSTMLYPCERIGAPLPGSIHDAEQMLRTHEVVAEVLINSWQDTYPLTYEGRQIHACGRFWTVLCADELRRALGNKHVETMGQTQYYRTAPLFAEWANYLMQLRTDYIIAGDKGMSDLCKLLTNSLHGKFAQRPQRWDFDPDSPARRRWGRWLDLDIDSGEQREFRALAGIVQKSVAGDEPEHTFPAISACIAANAREWLRTLILICPPKSVLYVATDSLLVTEEGYRAINSRHNRKIVGVDRLAIKDQGVYAEIRGQGHYSIEGRSTISGPFANAKDTGNGTYTTQLWSQAASIITRGPGAAVVGTETDWIEPESLPKGTLQDNGWITPLQLTPLPEWAELSPHEQRIVMARAKLI